MLTLIINLGRIILIGIGLYWFFKPNSILQFVGSLMLIAGLSTVHAPEKHDRH
jgi:hypothetical protein